MAFGTLLSIIDRLSVKTILTGSTGSICGSVCTVIFFLAALIMFVPPASQYLGGNYFESEFHSTEQPIEKYYSGADFILAISFRHKTSGAYADHSQILEELSAKSTYVSTAAVYTASLQHCDSSVFGDSETVINPIHVQDCIMLPSNLEFDINADSGFYPYIVTQFETICNDVFTCSSDSSGNHSFIKNLTEDYYYEVIFTSQILDERGQSMRQVHKSYSSEFFGQSKSAEVVSVYYGQKKTFIDDSVMPWWNNRSHHSLVWTGNSDGSFRTQTQLETSGFSSVLSVNSDYTLAYRYYKKLDFVLGMLGGGGFLLFLLFWVLVSYYNRTLQKIQNAEELMLQTDGKEVKSAQNLKKVSIPTCYVFSRILPGTSRQDEIIRQSEHQIDIIKIVKKLKVAQRNLTTKNLAVKFQSKDLQLQEQPTNQRSNHQNPQGSTESTLALKSETYEALKNSNNAQEIYENNPTALAILESEQVLEDVMQDEVFERIQPSINPVSSKGCKKCSYYFFESIRFLDVFGAKPSFSAQPESSSCCGLLLTLLIIFLSVGTFALTLSNIGKVQIITSYDFENPQEHEYEMISGDDLRMVVCFSQQAMGNLSGVSPPAKIDFFQYERGDQGSIGTKKVLQHQKMAENEFQSYFELSENNIYNSVASENCYKLTNGQRVELGGSYNTQNEKYFGFALSPFCSGTECSSRQNITNQNYLNFVNFNTFNLYISQNKYDPELNRLVSGVYAEALSESINRLNANYHRTETIYVSSVQTIDDTRQNSRRTKLLEQTFSYQEFEHRSEERKTNPSEGPGYEFIIRPNGEVKSIIRKVYKNDFVIGVIGGVFLFWYFFVHFWAKLYNHFKVRAKLAEVLNREDSYNYLFLLHFLYLSRIPSCLLDCLCSGIGTRVDRMRAVDQKMQQNLNYLSMIKQVDNCYRLSSSLFGSLDEKDLSLIYFKEKIDDSEQVQPRSNDSADDQGRHDHWGNLFGSNRQNNRHENGSFLGADDLDLISEQTGVGRDGTSGVFNNSNAVINIHQSTNVIKVNSQSKDDEKMINIDALNVPEKKKESISDPHSYRKPEESTCARYFKKIDAFQTPPELTLDGERDVKSVLGGSICLILGFVIFFITIYYVSLAARGEEYTVSYRRFIDEDLSVIERGEFGELQKGISLQTGSNFKFAVSFEQKDQYYPHNVTDLIGDQIGIRMMKVRTERNNGEINETIESFELQKCTAEYLSPAGKASWIGPYNDPTVYAQNVTFSYCVPDGEQLRLRGTPQDSVREHFKLNIYNRYGNQSGRLALNNFFVLYIPRYFMSVPEVDVFAHDFNYQMTTWSVFTDLAIGNIETNLTFSKLLITDKYFGRSRQSYNDRTSKEFKREDLDSVSNEYQRNLTFYYDGIIDHYVLDFPSSAEVFGIVGGVIGVFIFGVWCIVGSFNHYRMKYLIGQQLYTFDRTLASLQNQNDRRKRINNGNMESKSLVDREVIQKSIKKYNQYREIDLLLAWILTPIGYVTGDYNRLNETLRRVTLIVQRVEKDLNLFRYYKTLEAVKDAIDQNITLNSSEVEVSKIRLSQIYPKHICQKNVVENPIPELKKVTKKHNLSSFEQKKIKRALEAKIDLQKVLGGDRSLNKVFGLQSDEISSLWNHSSIHNGSNNNRVRCNNQGSVMMRQESDNSYSGRFDENNNEYQTPSKKEMGLQEVGSHQQLGGNAFTIEDENSEI